MPISKAHPVTVSASVRSLVLSQTVLHTVVSSLQQSGEHCNECKINKRRNYKLTVLKLQTSAI